MHDDKYVVPSESVGDQVYKRTSLQQDARDEGDLIEERDV